MSKQKTLVTRRISHEIDSSFRNFAERLALKKSPPIFTLRCSVSSAVEPLRFCVFLCFLWPFFFISLSPCLAESTSEISPGAPEPEMTIRRYFTGQSGYQTGDLITRSQLEELQGYLRRTRWRGPASHLTH